MDGMTVKGGHKLSVKEGAGLTKKGRDSINRRTGSNLKAPAPNAKPGTKDGNRRNHSVLAHAAGMVNAVKQHVVVGTVSNGF